MKFLRDTDTCINALKHSPAVLNRLLAQSRDDVAVSVSTEAELRTGAAKSTSASKTMRLIENFLRPLSIVEFNSTDAASAHSLSTQGGPFVEQVLGRAQRQRVNRKRWVHCTACREKA
jgi:predicted nucleic acid-binding protein